MNSDSKSDEQWNITTSPKFTHMADIKESIVHHQLRDRQSFILTQTEYGSNHALIAFRSQHHCRFWCSVAKSTPTLLQPHGLCIPPGSLSMGFPRPEYWSRLPFPSLGHLPDLGIKLTSPAYQTDSLPLSHQRSPDIT